VVGSGLSVAPDGTLLVASALGGTVSQVTAGIGLSGGTITTIGTIDLVPATNASLGGIKVGANLSIAPDGTLSALPPNPGTINAVIAGTGLQGGGTTGSVTLSLRPASTTQVGGVSIAAGGGLTVTGASLSLDSATTTQLGGVRLATTAEVITGTDSTVVVTPATLAAKTATTLRPGIVQLSDSVAVNDSTVAATQTAVKTAYDAAITAQSVANNSLTLAGGTMTGIITFAAGQTFPGVALPIATTASLGVIKVGTGLNINLGGVLSTVNNGTVTGITPGPGLGAPATGNTITTSGTLRLLPPTTDGLQLGGVKQGANINIAVDGTISVPLGSFIQTGNHYAFNGYQWPIPRVAPALPCPGDNGQVLTIIDNTTGELGWTSTGALSSVVAGTGVSVTTSNGTATVSLSTVPSLVAGSYGGTALIPTLAINQYGQITSAGLANPYSPYQTATVTAPLVLVLDFAQNNLHWEWVLQGNITIHDPLNAESGQSGYLKISQNPLIPYTITWGAAWKFENFTPYSGNGTLAAVDMIAFTVVSPNYIVVTNVIKDIG
jgi:hypothetical protein